MTPEAPSPLLHFVVPGSLDRPTGGDRYDARMADALRRRGLSVRVHGIPGSFPRTDGEFGADLDGALDRLPEGSQVVIDGLVLGGLPDPPAVHGERLSILALVHHPLVDETGLHEEKRAHLLASEGRALAAVAGVVVTSPHTAKRVQELFGVSPDRIRVAVPGTDPAPPAAGPESGEPPRLLSVGAVIPRKGHDVLIEALARLSERSWTLDCVGSLTAAPEYARRVRDSASRVLGDDRVRFRGRVSEERLASLFHRSSAFVLASHYEGYGMALAEALARGLPVVSTTGGAIPDTVPPDAGILVPPGEPDPLTEALDRLLGPSGPRLLAALSRAARRHAVELPDWDEAAEAFHQAVDQLLAPASPGGNPAPSAVFDASWLELREPVDHRSRNPELVSRLRTWWRRPTLDPGGARASGGRSLQRRRILDLGSGTGSNLRYLAPRLALPGQVQEWTLTDQDPELLARAAVPETPAGPTIELRRVRADLDRIREVEMMEDALARPHLVTSSAFLDLASRAWIEALVEACAEAGAGAYVALTYDGTIRWWEDPDARRPLSVSGPTDSEMEEIVNAHQRRDKGLGGVAAGPDAARMAAEAFREAGYRTWLRPSPWRLGPEDARRVRRLLEGWESAALEEQPGRAHEIHEWAENRRRALDRGAFGVTVGHLDLLALPPEPRGGQDGGGRP